RRRDLRIPVPGRGRGRDLCRGAEGLAPLARAPGHRGRRHRRRGRAPGEAGREEGRVREALVGDGGAERAAVLRDSDEGCGEGRCSQRVALGKAPLIRPFGPLSPRKRGEGSFLASPSSAPSGHLLPAGGEKGVTGGGTRRGG